MVDKLNVQRTDAFDKWLSGLKDVTGKAAINTRLKRLEGGNWGDSAPVGGGVTELRIHLGPGYRVYCWKDGATLVVALGGGSKNGQQSDINTAIAMAAELSKEST